MGHLGDDMVRQAVEDPAMPMLPMAPGILHLVEGTLKPFALGVGATL